MLFYTQYKLESLRKKTLYSYAPNLVAENFALGDVRIPFVIHGDALPFLSSIPL